MFLVLLSSSVTTFIISGLFYYSNNHYKKSIQEYIDIKYKKWLNLNYMMSTKYKSPIAVKIMSVYMIFKFFYLNLIQYLTNSVVKVDKNIYEVNYIINGKFYKMIIKPERGPSSFEQILNDKDENVIEEVMSYYGPHYNNQVKLKPSFFNTSKLRFICLDESEIVFNENEKIIL